MSKTGKHLATVLFLLSLFFQNPGNSQGMLHQEWAAIRTSLRLPDEKEKTQMFTLIEISFCGGVEAVFSRGSGNKTIENSLDF